MKITDLRGFCIDENDASKLKIANLPTRPNSTTLTGAKGLTANQLREKMDEYPEALRGTLNDVIDSIVAAFESKTNVDNLGNNVKSSPIIEDILLYDTNAEGDSNNPRLTLKMLADALLYGELHTHTVLMASQLYDETVKTNHIVNGAVTREKLSSALDELLTDLVNRITDAEGNIDSAFSSISYVEGRAETAIANAESASHEAAAAQKRADDAFYLAEGKDETQVFEDKEEMEGWIQSQVCEHLPTYSTIAIKDGDVLAFSYDSSGAEGHGDFAKCTVKINRASDQTLPEEIDLVAGVGIVYNNYFKTQNGGRNVLYFSLPNSIEKLYILSATVYFPVVTADGMEMQELQRENVIVKSVKANLIGTAMDASKYNIAVGTNFLLRALDVPDFWWDGFEAQYLETQKVDLSGYPTEKEVKEGLQTILDALNEALGEEVTS